MNEKILIFEGAGWEGADSSKATDLLNCRIRTRFKNNDGRLIYLELGGFLTNSKYPQERYKNFKIGCHIDSCHYDDIDWDKRSCSSKDLSKYMDCIFEYNKENLLKFVNEKLNCSFTDIKTINDNSIRVHDTKEPLSDCSKPNAKPFVDEPILFEIIKDIVPKYQYKNSNVAEYSLKWETIKDFDFINKHMTEHTNKDSFYITIRHYDGKITSAELTNTSYFPCIGLDKETARQLINKLKLELLEV